MAEHDAGAYHGCEIPYVFQHLEHERSWTPEDYRQSTFMLKYWTNFARTGNPSSKGTVEWPQFDTTAQQTMTFSDNANVSSPPRESTMAFWDEYFADRRIHPHAPVALTE